MLTITWEDFNLEGSTFGPEIVDLSTHFGRPQNVMDPEIKAKEAAREVKKAFWAEYHAQLNVSVNHYISALQMWRFVTHLVPKIWATQVTMSECPSCKTTKARGQDTSS